MPPANSTIEDEVNLKVLHPFDHFVYVRQTFHWPNSFRPTVRAGVPDAITTGFTMDAKGKIVRVFYVCLTTTDGLDLDPAETVDPNADAPWFGLPVVAKSVHCKQQPMVCVYNADLIRVREAKSRIAHINLACCSGS